MTQPARSVTFASGNFTLEGVLHLPDDTPAATAVICHPGAQYGGDMDNHVVMALCDALNERGSIAGSRAMAGQLMEITGIDPLTIDQTAMTEHSAARFEHPLYRHLVDEREITTASVLVNDAG